MDIKNKVLETIKTHEMFDDDAHIVLGLSGGPDSMCLFDVLLELSEEKGYHIYPVHINHKLRPGDAERDQEFVEEICRQRGLTCRTFAVDCNKLAREEGLTSEEAGRKARYAAFFEVAEQIAEKIAAEGSKKNEAETQEQITDGILPEHLAEARKKIAIAVAQNANDQAETILFRILRGAGTDGLAGIAYKRYERGMAVVRPLLDVPREEIEKYCESRNLSPRIDHTNKEAIYDRNKIRLELLPMLMKKFNPNIVETIDRLGKNAATDKDYIWQQAETAYREIMPESSKNDTTVTVDISRLSVLHKAVRIRLYNMILAKIGMAENISEGQLESIEKIRLSQNPSAMCDLVDGYAVYKEYEKLRFCGKRAQTSVTAKYRMRFMSSEEYAAGEGARLSDASQDGALRDSTLKNNGPGSIGKHSVVGVFAVPPEAKNSICIRKRRDGDVIAIAARSRADFDGSAAHAALAPANAAGAAGATIRHKKLQDFFVDAKVPRNKRDEIDLLAYGNKILWVLPSPYFASEQYRKKGRFSAEFRLQTYISQAADKTPAQPAEDMLRTTEANSAKTSEKYAKRSAASPGCQGSAKTPDRAAETAETAAETILILEIL